VAVCARGSGHVSRDAAPGWLRRGVAAGRGGKAPRDGAGQDFVARFFAQTQSFSFDKAGRIGLDDALIAHAGIKRDAVLVGSLTKFNIYAPARWGKVEDRTSGENFGDLMRRIGI
jgi:MraZ protein